MSLYPKESRVLLAKSKQPVPDVGTAYLLQELIMPVCVGREVGALVVRVEDAVSVIDELLFLTGDEVALTEVLVVVLDAKGAPTQ